MTRRNAGFSLIEVMVAVLILGIALTGLTQGITTALSSSKDAELQTTAALLAAGQIEALRAEGFLIEGELEGQGEGSLEGYTWTQTVTETVPEGLYEVSVVVRHGTPERDVFELKTLLFDPPIIQEPEERDERNRRRP